MDIDPYFDRTEIDNRLSITVMIKEFERVILTEDIPGTELRKGDVGVVVEIYNEGEGYEVEFFALNGDTVAVETLESRQVRSATNREILHVRELNAT
ncbi:DUF4926 domain-containing protein [Telluribacter humicola]|uniref:DUF4926 domain-containing protein n=1 Tax=Telluribacter humicola TaxID=1720261 RepID=UPI001E491B96|nr:DUF4926 domain-containing protein [Telluribacter humicola]